jgi:hypothetical protein
MLPFPRRQEGGPPPHIQSRNQALTDLSSLLSSRVAGHSATTSSHLTPPALPYSTGYLKAVERDCVREVCGVCQNWRSPRAADWRVFPEIDAERAKEQRDVLIAHIYNDAPAGTDRTGPRALPSTGHPMRTEFLVLHSGEQDMRSAAWPMASVLPPRGSALDFVQQRVMADLSRDSRGNDFYVEVGYVGDLVHSMAATTSLMSGRVSVKHSAAFECLEGGSIRSAQWCHPDEITDESILGGESLVNEAQCRALAGLSQTVELIRGPPGTGKSHTVATLAKYSVPPAEAVVITAVQNRAVEATAEKFHREGVCFVTFGSRLTGISQRYTLAEQVQRHPLVVARRVHLRRLQNQLAVVEAVLSTLRGAIYQPMQPGEDSHRAQARDEYIIRSLCEAPSDELQATAEYRRYIEDRATAEYRDREDRQLLELVTAFHVRRKKIAARGWSKVATAVVRHRYATTTRLQEHLSTEEKTTQYNLVKEEHRAKDEIVRQARALLCTTASVGGATRAAELKTLTGRITTVVVDEAGTVADRHLLPILVNCPIQRWVFVGDTRQLPVFTCVRGVQAQSTMERLELQGLPVALLSIQYRMPQAVCDIVSRCFYEGQLVSAEQQPRGRHSVRFEGVRGTAEKERNGTSMVNRMEIETVITVVKGLITSDVETPAVVHNEQPPIAIITTYAAQVRALEDRLVEEALEHRQRAARGNRGPAEISANNVEVITIDGAQGREWAHVVISTVSSKPCYARFIKDPRRLCVALSRCKKSMTLVAHPDLVTTIPALAAVQAAAHGDDARVTSLADAMGSLAVSAVPPSSAAASAAHSDGRAPPPAASQDEDGHGICPITQQRFQDPVVAADGHTYERTAIRRWLARHNTSPMTREQLDNTVLIPNHAERSRARA